MRATPQRRSSAENKSGARGCSCAFNVREQDSNHAWSTTYLQMPELSTKRIEHIIAMRRHESLQAGVVSAMRRRAQKSCSRSLGDLRHQWNELLVGALLQRSSKHAWLQRYLTNRIAQFLQNGREH